MENSTIKFLINICWLLCIVFTSLLVAVITSGVKLEGLMLFMLSLSTLVLIFCICWGCLLYIADKAGL